MKKAYVFPQPLNRLFTQFIAEQKRTVSCLHLRCLTCRVEYYVYLRQWAMGMRYESVVNGRGVFGDWRQLVLATSSYKIFTECIL